MLRLLTEKGRVVIERVNMVKRHTKPTQRNPRGGIMEKEGSVEVSNVALLVRQVRRARGARRSTSTEGQKKRRVCVKCGTVVRDRVRGFRNGSRQRRRREKAAGKAGKPELTPEQEAEVAAKKAARAEAKAKGGKARQGQGAAAAARRSRTERVKRDAPPRLRKLYDAEVRAKLMKEFSLTNRMQAPQADEDHHQHGPRRGGHQPEAARQRRRGAAARSPGQRRWSPSAKKSIAVFKLRAGQKIGAMVTLRREQMYEFFDRLVNFALPRVRDFKGVSPKSFDGRGNYTLGIREEIIFPEINFEKLDKPKGMNITFNTQRPNDEQGRALLKHLGMPFRN